VSALLGRLHIVQAAAAGGRHFKAGARAAVLGPVARWACPVVGGLLVVAGLLGLLVAGGR
jgi:hypothetical protein